MLRRLWERVARRFARADSTTGPAQPAGHEARTEEERTLQRADVERDRAVRESHMRQGQQPENVRYW